MAEVVADDGYPRGADVAHKALQPLHLLRSARAVQQDIVPEAWIEVLYCVEREAFRFNGFPQGRELLRCPQLRR